MVDPDIKYGGGDDAIREVLTKNAQNVAALELIEQKLPQSPSLREEVLSIKQKMADHSNEWISELERITKER